VSEDPKQPLTFRLGRSYKEALDRMAAEQDKPVDQLAREVVEGYVAEQAKAAWEAEARRTAIRLAETADDPASDEAEMQRTLDAGLEAFAEECA
jgi:mono/diheme cytochrome c family protein